MFKEQVGDKKIPFFSVDELSSERLNSNAKHIKQLEYNVRESEGNVT